MAAVCSWSAIFAGEAAISAAAPAYNNEQTVQPAHIADGVILHCFCWKLSDIIAELPNIAAAGFTAVQTSPMQRAVKTTDVWYDVYRPYDYCFIDNAMGNSQEMAELCRQAEAYGIKVIVDVVANHGTGKNEAHDPWWDQNDRMRWDTAGIDWSSRYSETHNALGNYGETNSDDPEVQQRTLEYIRYLKSLGVKGLRWDAAKHITLPSEGCDFWSVTMSEPDIWSYGEILGTPVGENKYELLKEYASLMHITDSRFTGSDARSSLYSHGINADRCVYWAESHDTYCNEGATVSLTENDIDRTWALLASRKGATALYLSRPFEKVNGRIKVGVKGSTHFTAKEVAAVNHFHNAMGNLDEEFDKIDGAKAVYRQKGVVIVKPGGGKVSLPLHNLEAEGIYKDEVTGNTFTVAGENISGVVDAATGIAVVYDYENPPTPQMSITVSSPGEEFNSKNYILIITAHHATSASYSINGGQPVEFAGEVKLQLGRIMQPGETAEIAWTATGNGGTLSGKGAYTYTDVEPEQPTRVFLHFDDPDWDDTFYTFIYDDKTNNGSWPGKKMTRDDALSINGYTGGWYYYDVPETLKFSGRAIVSNNGPRRHPEDMQPGIPLDGKNLIFMHHNGEWTTTSNMSASVGNLTLSADTTPAGYYTLQGIKVSEPRPGNIYIVRYHSGKVTKVAIPQ